MKNSVPFYFFSPQQLNLNASCFPTKITGNSYSETKTPEQLLPLTGQPNRNKYMENESYTFTEGELKGLKQGWHDLYDHCLREIDRRFPPENMAVFQQLQVLYPCDIHGAMRNAQAPYTVCRMQYAYSYRNKGLS
jgi:hypothetical protein